MGNASVFIICNRLHKKQNDFGPLNDHMIKEFSWVVTMVIGHASTDIFWWPGPRLNIKTVLSTYGDFHVKDKTAVRTSYL